MVSFFTSSYYSCIKSIFKISIIKINKIIFKFNLIGVIVKNAIYNVKKMYFFFYIFSK